jgi:hypothetical protein
MGDSSQISMVTPGTISAPFILTDSEKAIYYVIGMGGGFVLF